MKLTPFSRILIILVILAGVFFAAQQFLPQLSQNQDSQKDTTEYVDNDAQQEETKTTKTQKRDTRSTFNYSAPKPVNGTLQGVVELGASGFNSFIINVDRNKNWELKKAEYGASLVYENMATEQDVRDGLKKYIATMLNYGVGGKEIHFMVSSSAIKSPDVQKIRKGLKSLGYVVNSVNATQEGQYALKAVLPKTFESSAYVVDIGSGNTKISWMENGQIKSEESYGSKYFQKNVSDDRVYNAIRGAAAKIPSGKTKTCFIIGGAPFDLAKVTREGKERYTVLRNPDEYDVEEQKTKSGINIYKALQDETDTDTFVFDWDANFTIGFLLSL